jgi:hypothetical protein
MSAAPAKGGEGRGRRPPRPLPADFGAPAGNDKNAAAAAAAGARPPHLLLLRGLLLLGGGRSGTAGGSASGGRSGRGGRSTACVVEGAGRVATMVRRDCHVDGCHAAPCLDPADTGQPPGPLLGSTSLRPRPASGRRGGAAACGGARRRARRRGRRVRPPRPACAPARHAPAPTLVIRSSMLFLAKSLANSAGQ